MCDSTKCDNCNKHSQVLVPVDESWKYVCESCKREIDEGRLVLK